MKYLLLVCLLVASTLAHSQKEILKFNEEDILINGVSITVANTQLKGDLKTIKKSWKKFVKTNLGQKLSEKNDVLSAKGVVINQITDKRGDLMVYVYNKDNDVLLNVAFKLGYDVYLDSKKYPAEFAKMQSYLEYFTNNYYNDYLPTFIKAKKKSLKVLTKENKRSEKQVKKANKCIKKYDKKIGKQERKIVKLEKKDGTEEKQKGRSEKIAEYQIEKSRYKELLRVHTEIINALAPKIEETNKSINSANLTLIEVRSKIKTDSK